MCDKFKEMGIENEAQVVHITGQPGYTTAIERAKGFEDRLPEVCPNVTQSTRSLATGTARSRKR
jgi:ribose transport system substrate-binding protein